MSWQQKLVFLGVIVIVAIGVIFLVLHGPATPETLPSPNASFPSQSVGAPLATLTPASPP